MRDDVLDPSYLGNLSEMQCADGGARVGQGWDRGEVGTGWDTVKLGEADKSGNP